MPARIPLLIANNFHKQTISKLDEIYDTHKLWLLDPQQQESLIMQLKPHCHAVATASWATNPLIYELPELQMISCFGVGVDGIDFSITRSRNIAVSNTPDVLMTCRKLVAADKFTRSGAWLDGPFTFGESLAGKTLGIIGLGSIGEAIAERALPFKMKIAYHNRNPKNLPYSYYHDLEELAEASDVLLCMLPGGAATHRIIGESVFRRLGPNGYFINVGRGSSVDENALVSALQGKVIAGAGLDVYYNEPHVPDALKQLDNVVLLPHIGSATHQTRMAMGELVIRNLNAWAEQRPLLTRVDLGS